MKTTLRRCLSSAIALFLTLAAAIPTAAQTAVDMMNPAALLYVIKVTPTLVYMDAGETAGLRVGESYILLAEREGKNKFNGVAEVRVIRVHEEFCIAEILSVEMGQEVEVLQRAISMVDWEMMGAMAMDADEARMTEGSARSWSLHVIGGADLNKAVELRLRGGALTGTKEILDAGVGLRLGRQYDKWRLNLTLRSAGLMADADITQLSAELDAHLLFRGMRKAGPYIGVGVGEHRLSGDVMGGSSDSSFKTGFNGVAGLHLPAGKGGWSWDIETGYQLVMAWNNTIEIDASHVRVHLGLGKAF